MQVLLLVSLFLTVAFSAGGKSVSPSNEVPPEAASLYLVHRRGGEFFNPWGEMEGKAWDFIRWKVFDWSPYEKWRKPELPVVVRPERPEPALPHQWGLDPLRYAGRGGG